MFKIKTFVITWRLGLAPPVNLNLQILTSVADFVEFSAGTGGMKIALLLRFVVAPTELAGIFKVFNEVEVTFESDFFDKLCDFVLFSSMMAASLDSFKKCLSSLIFCSGGVLVGASKIVVSFEKVCIPSFNSVQR